MSQSIAVFGLCITGAFIIYLFGIIFQFRKVEHFGRASVGMFLITTVMIAMLFEYVQLLWLTVFAIPFMIIEFWTDTYRGN